MEEAGLPAAKLFADQIASALILINLVLLGTALLFTPEVVSVLAPGLSDDPERFDLAVALTRITFPYLALVSLQTLFSGILNANNRFAMAASAPILLNLSLIATLLLAPFFPDAGHAAAWAYSSPASCRCWWSGAMRRLTVMVFVSACRASIRRRAVS
ncbi:MAG: hypothetical protein A49_01730 [Methyloceanibacter sp.]|nr:MAG: hypothetical protein A49_01730 [Methyloceanibacter sp.]